NHFSGVPGPARPHMGDPREGANQTFFRACFPLMRETGLPSPAFRLPPPPIATEGKLVNPRRGSSPAAATRFRLARASYQHFCVRRLYAADTFVLGLPRAGCLFSHLTLVLFYPHFVVVLQRKAFELEELVTEDRPDRLDESIPSRP